MNSSKTNLIRKIGLGYQILSGLCGVLGLIGIAVYYCVISFCDSRILYDSIYIKSAKTISWIFHNFGLVSLIQVMFSVVLYLVSIYFIKLHSWAKKALELITITFIIFIIWFDFIFIRELIPLTKGLPIVFTRIVAFLGVGIWTLPFVKALSFLLRLENSLFKR